MYVVFIYCIPFFIAVSSVHIHPILKQTLVHPIVHALVVGETEAPRLFLHGQKGLLWTRD